MTNNSDHVRKYDDWRIEPSTQPICPGAVGGVCPPDYRGHDTVENTAEPVQQSEHSVSPTAPAPELGATNPFAGAAGQNAPTPKVDHTPLDTDSVASGESEPMIDPDTGLEIPDYMKPFVNRN